MGGGVEIAPMHECTRRDALPSPPALVDRRRRLCANRPNLGGPCGGGGERKKARDIRKGRLRKLMRVRDSGGVWII